jgi:hypothetical protein
VACQSKLRSLPRELLLDILDALAASQLGPQPS